MYGFISHVIGQQQMMLVQSRLDGKRERKKLHTREIERGLWLPR